MYQRYRYDVVTLWEEVRGRAGERERAPRLVGRESVGGYVGERV